MRGSFSSILVIVLLALLATCHADGERGPSLRELKKHHHKKGAGIKDQNQGVGENTKENNNDMGTDASDTTSATDVDNIDGGTDSTGATNDNGEEGDPTDGGDEEDAEAEVNENANASEIQVKKGGGDAQGTNEGGENQSQETTEQGQNNHQGNANQVEDTSKKANTTQAGKNVTDSGLVGASNLAVSSTKPPAGALVTNTTNGTAAAGAADAAIASGENKATQPEAVATNSTNETATVVHAIEQKKQSKSENVTRVAEPSSDSKERPETRVANSTNMVLNTSNATDANAKPTSVGKNATDKAADKEADDSEKATNDSNEDADSITPVTLAFWTTPRYDWDAETGVGPGPNVEILSFLRDMVQELGSYLEFEPQMYISDGRDFCDEEGSIAPDADMLLPSAQEEVCENSCLDGNIYCTIPATDPVHYQIKGKQVVQEALRRMCIWIIYGVNPEDGSDDQVTNQMKYFDYIQRFETDKCDVKFSKACSSHTLKTLEMDWDGVDDCMDTDSDIILHSLLQLENATGIHDLPRLPAVVVDGEPLLNGQLTKDYVYHAVCSKYPAAQLPSACANHMVKPEILPMATLQPTTMPSVAPSMELPTIAPTDEGETVIVKKPAEKPVQDYQEENKKFNAKDVGDVTAAKEESVMAVTRMNDTNQSFDGGNSSSVDGLFGLDENTTAAILEAGVEFAIMLESCGVDPHQVLERIGELIGTGGYFSVYDEASDLEKDLPLLMSQTCSADDAEDLLADMEAFHKCSLFDLQGFLEMLPSTSVGVIMRCAKAYSTVSKSEVETGFIPDECIRALEGESMIGRALFGLFLYPDIACPCMEDLYLSIPECTVDQGIIPINGAAIKVESCMAMHYCHSMDSMCDKNLQILNKCLPPLAGVGQDNMKCDAVFEKCSDFYSSIPSMLNAAPLPDACQRIAKGSRFYGMHVTERYNMFREKCGQNQELWEAHTPEEEFKAFVAEDITKVDYKSHEFITGALAGAAAAFVAVALFNCIRCICRCLCRCCCGKSEAKSNRGTYSTLDNKFERFPEYRDDPSLDMRKV